MEGVSALMCAVEVTGATAPLSSGRVCKITGTWMSMRAKDGVTFDVVAE